MGLCHSCRALGNDLARLEAHPEAFQLRLGELAKKFGHNYAHAEIRRLYHARFRVPSLDEWITA